MACALYIQHVTKLAAQKYPIENRNCKTEVARKTELRKLFIERMLKDKPNDKSE